MSNTLTPFVFLMVSLVPGSGDDNFPGRDGAIQFEGQELLDTEWKGTLGAMGQPIVIRFERGGVACMTMRGRTMRSMSWNQQGSVLSMKATNGYSEFRLVLDGQRLSGEGHSRGGQHWAMDLKYAGPSKYTTE